VAMAPPKDPRDRHLVAKTRLQPHRVPAEEPFTEPPDRFATFMEGVAADVRTKLEPVAIDGADETVEERIDRLYRTVVLKDPLGLRDLLGQPHLTSEERADKRRRARELVQERGLDKINAKMLGEL